MYLIIIMKRARRKRRFRAPPANGKPFLMAKSSINVHVIEVHQIKNHDDTQNEIDKLVKNLIKQKETTNNDV